MTTIPSPDRLTGLVEAALGQARITRSILYDQVIPQLPPLSRGGAEHIARCINRGQIFRPQMLDDLEALFALLEREAQAGMHEGWEADECHVNGGWPSIWLDERSVDLLHAASQLDRLQSAIAAALDAAEAERIASSLHAGD